MDGRRVLVTGATGFIGRRVFVALLGAGAEVTALVRSRAGRAGLPESVRSVVGAIENADALASALEGQDVLVNLAHDIRASAETNLAAFDRLIAAATVARVGRIVHLSSIVVYDAWPDHDCAETGSMDRPGGGGYRQAKIAMEHRLMAGALPAAILQPTIVYGPGSTLWTDGFAAALLAGGVVVPEPEGLCNGVFVDDVAAACVRAAALPDLKRERFIISGPAPFAWSALLEGYAKILGRGEVKRVPVAELERALGPKPDESAFTGPSTAARVSALARRLIGHRRFERLLRLLRRRLSRGTPMMPDHHLLAEFSGGGTCRIDHARVRLGHTPAFDLERGLDACDAYLKTFGR